MPRSAGSIPRHAMVLCILIALTGCQPLLAPQSALPSASRAAPAQGSGVIAAPSPAAPTAPTPTAAALQLANPASVNCAKQGGKLTIEQRGGDGGQYGICVFEDNRQCEEWALLRGECPVGGLKVTGYFTPAAQYCAITGGTYQATGKANTPNETGTCALKTGQTCEATAYYNGQCPVASETPPNAEPAGRPNPASVNCIQEGGALSIKERGDGGQYGICVFEDNRQCEEWALLRGDCPAGGLKVTGYVTPAGLYCAITGGTYQATGNANTANEAGTCTLKSGQACDAAAYYNGQCPATSGPSPTVEPTTQPMGKPNPASVNCIQQGGKLTIAQRGDGGQYGICIFEDNRQCEEWALLRGDCPVGGVKVSGHVTPAAQYCAITGGTYQVTGNANTASETGTCTLKNGQSCDTAAYYNGQCPATAEQPAPTAPTASPSATGEAATKGGLQTAEYGGVKITFDPALAKSARGDTVQAVPAAEGPWLGGGTPEAVRFLFDSAQLPQYFDPRLPQALVYKTEDWVKLDPKGAKAVADLEAVLANRPAPLTAPIPVLPPPPMQQAFIAKARYLDFAEGSGAGFVAYYTIAVNPVTANDLFYTFQGLTNDGRYYVTVFWPVTTSILPAQATMDADAYNKFASNYDAYLKDMAAQLDGLLPGDYSPDLTLIEGLVQSIQVSDSALKD